MEVSVAELFLAYRQAKVSIHQEHQGPWRLTWARTEPDLPAILARMRQQLNSSPGWFSGISPGEVWLLPKKAESRKNSSGVTRTLRLAAAFRDHRHLRSPNVLCQDDGQPLTRQMVQYRVLRASRRAKLSQDGVHILRHTFCSHLAMRGAPPRAIQELAGHRELGMTQRYMHLSPAALDHAIRLLDQPFSVQSFGDILETGRVSEGKING